MNLIARSILTVVLLIQLSLNCTGQAISGIVLDGSSGKPVPFVNIVFNNNPGVGTVTDIDGAFVIPGKDGIEKITLSHISYRDTAIVLTSADITLGRVTVALTPSSVSLSEAVVYAGENPAIVVIEKAISNKKLNDPEQRPSYSYHAYHKSVFDMRAPDASSIADSIRMLKEGFFRGGHLFIIETETKQYYRRPGVRNEELISTRVSGVERPGFGSIPTMLQPFGFYRDEIQIVDSKFVNPISKFGLHEYFFDLRDTVMTQGDTVYVISFKPKHKDDVDGLNGIVHIKSGEYAIVRVEASPAHSVFVDFNILQEYDDIHEGIWFPSEMKAELRYGMAVGTEEEATLEARFRSYIDSVEIGGEIGWRNFSPEPVRVVGRPWDRDSVYWAGLRPVKLTGQEQVTYEVMDSLGKEFRIDDRMFLLEKLFQLKVPVSFIDFNLARLIEFNYVEKVMPGLFIQTNERLSNRFSIMAGIQYSFATEYLKYGGGVEYKHGQWDQNSVTVQYFRGTTPPGMLMWRMPYSTENFIRNFFVRNLDATETWNVGYTVNTFRTQLKVGLVRSNVRPLYDYTYSNSNSELKADHTFVGAEINFRMRFSGRLVRDVPFMTSAIDGLPELSISYQRGLGSVGGEIGFNKIELKLAKSFSMGRFGGMTLEGGSGYIDRSVPYRYLFFMNGFYENKLGLYVGDGFQTSEPYYFSADRYAEVAVEYRAPFSLYTSSFSSPKPVLRHRMYWGDIDHDSDAHEVVEIGMPSQGYYETGIQFEDLIRLKYFRAMFINFGIGAYMNYGPYASPDAWDNLSFKISARVSTR